MVAFALVVGSGDPSYFYDAISCRKSEKWMTTMMNEMESLHKNNLRSS